MNTNSSMEALWVEPETLRNFTWNERNSGLRSRG